MSEIKIFENEQFGKIRTAGTSEEPLFCLADVCRVLELGNPSQVKTRLGDALISNEAILDSLGRTQQAVFVNEDGLYDVILDSRKPEARTFRKWITSEVLPSIRKTGQYNVFKIPQTYAEALRLAADQQEQIEYQQKQIEANTKEIVELNGAIAMMQPKVSYVDAILASKETVTITQIAQDYGCSAKTFNGWLRDFGIQHKVGDQWILYAKHLPCGYVQPYTISITHKNGSKGTAMHTKWTQKGRLFLYEELKRHNVFPVIEQDKTKGNESNTQQVPQRIRESAQKGIRQWAAQ